jgi:glutaredoxin
LPKFEGSNVQVLGISIDHNPCLVAWAESLGGITYPLLSDFWPHGAVARQYGVLRSEGRSERAIFIIDSQGIIRYIDIHDIDQQPDNDVLLLELAKLEGNQSLTPHIPTEEEINNLPRGGVVMYCTSWCPDCRNARQWFKDHGVKYQEVNITDVPGASNQLRKWTNGTLTTPTFDIDGEIIVDFDVKRLKEILKVSD